MKVLTHEAAEYADYLVVPKVDALQAAHEAVSPAAVLVPSYDRDWQLGTFDLGFYFALGVAGLGLLGALKALLTGPKVR